MIKQNEHFQNQQKLMNKQSKNETIEETEHKITKNKNILDGECIW